MPAVAKTINVLGAIAKIETTYGTSIALNATDGFLLTYADRNVGAPLNIEYAFDGQVGINPGNLGNQPLVAPSGKSFTGDLPVRFKGAGIAYTAAVKPALADIALQIAGFTGALTTTTSAEAWVYTPTPATSAYKSACFNVYARGEFWPLKGVVANWSYTFSDPQPPVHTISISGIANGDVTDVTLPAITYPHLTVDPPNASAVAIVIGSYTTNVVCYSGSFNLNRTVEPRVALTGSAAHEGFIPGGYNPELTLVVEASAFVATPFHTSAGLDPIKLREAATKITVSLQFGSTQYNRWIHSFANCQLFKVTPTAVNRAAAWELVFRPSNSSPISADDMTVSFT